MHYFTILLVIAGVIAVISPESSTQMTSSGNPLVIIPSGQLRGKIGKNFDGEEIYEFFGIPYAKPPVGERRFQPPEPPEPWSGIRNATEVAESCISRDDFERYITGSEDCLYLNVYTKRPLQTNSTLKPTMVFIHGGGLTVGSSSPHVYGPDFLLLKDIVLVTFNYRLGALGFLSFDDPSLGVFGNMGLKDQVLALKWVRSNIRNFGGDPDNITIFGNSAGGSSVHAHILSKASKGLFHKAILQSGCALNSWFWGSKNNGVELVPDSKDQAEALKKLKTMDFREIFKVQEKIYDSPYPADRRPFSAVIETPNPTAFLDKNPVDIIKEGGYNEVPIMMGYTQDEGMLLDLDKIEGKKMGVKVPDLELGQIIPVNLGVEKCSDSWREIAEALGKLYPPEALKTSYGPMTDSFFLVGIFESLKLHLKTSTLPIYLYRMSLNAGLNQLKILLNKTQEPGVGHSDELGYLFHSSLTPPITPGSIEDKSMRKFVDLWTNFARNGNPALSQNSGSPSWLRVKEEKHIAVMDIGTELEMKRDIPERNRLEEWWKILDKYPLRTFS
ncbi:esterase B1-like [Euwallacea similis]|uniref:esterase B1-like n=1 Tax=Euwallacea similis TaxID=1736056 RepID=UPI003450B868